MTEISDPAALLAAAAQGDAVAFRVLYDGHCDLLFGIALRITRDRVLAADVLQDAFLQIWRNAGGFDPTRGSPEAWMIGIVRYRALDRVRRRKRDDTDLNTAEPLAGIDGRAAADLANAMGGGDDAHALARCLHNLPEDRRHLIIAAFVDGYSQSELAARLAAPLGTIKSWIRRSLESLRICLQGA